MILRVEVSASPSSVWDEGKLRRELKHAIAEAVNQVMASEQPIYELNRLNFHNGAYRAKKPTDTAGAKPGTIQE